MKRSGREPRIAAARAVVAGVLGMVVLATPAAAQDPPAERERAPAQEPVVHRAASGDAAAERAAGPEDRRHTVRKGDTLWDLARHYLADPFLWPLIHEANRRDIRDPHWIYPRQVFRIPGVPGPAVGGRGNGMHQAADATAVNLGALTPATRTRFYYGAPARRTMSTAEILAAEALEHMRVGVWEHHSAPWLSDPGALPVVGGVKAVPDLLPGVASAADVVRPFQEVFITHRRERQLVQGEQLLLVRPGRRIGGWGRVIEPRAVVRVEEVHGDGATATVIRQFGRTGAGDVAIPLAPFPGVEGPAVEPVRDGPRGRIVAMAEDRQVHRVTDHGFIDMGRAHGLQVGDELMVYMPERRVQSDRVPAERVATVRVVRVGDQHSTVRVLDLHHPVLTVGLPVQLVRTAP